jgi:acyl dehydratase
MALNPDATGHRTKPLTRTYRWQDVVQYALGIGARRDDHLAFLYEGLGPKVFPTYAVIPAMDANEDLFEVVGGDFTGVVHGMQDVVCHNPFPPAATIETVGEVIGVYDLKRMAQAVVKTTTSTEDGTLLAETTWTLMYLKDGGYGGQAPPRSPRIKAPAREPDWRVEEPTTKEQALLYRLSGDLNPLHADPAAAMEAEKVTGGVPILHGLCTYGMIGRAFIDQECEGDPTRMARITGRFSKPVWPGETLVVEGWRDMDREDPRVVLQASTLERGEPVFTNAFATLKG